MMFDQSGKVPCVNNPEKVVGLRGANFPSMIASGIAHSIAIGQTEGVLTCGSTVLQSTMTEEINYAALTKLAESRFNSI